MRTFIRELKEGSSVTSAFIFDQVSAKTTKSGKPYLYLDVTDGTDKIAANYWDWSGKNKPNANDTVYEVDAEVTSYMGVKQLKINAIRTSAEYEVDDFIPRTGIDLEALYKEAYSLMGCVDNDALRSVGLKALEDFMSDWVLKPAAVGMHHAFVGGLLVHSYTVGLLSYRLANTMNDAHYLIHHKQYVDSDLCLVGGMLHDIGKILAYDFNGATPCMTIQGKLYEHSHLGAEMLKDLIKDITIKYPSEATKLELLVHIVLSHHGLPEYGAAVPPMCIEGYIVNHADGVDATTQMILEASNKVEDEAMLTQKIYPLNNREKINPVWLHNLELSEDRPF